MCTWSKISSTPAEAWSMNLTVCIPTACPAACTADVPPALNSFGFHFLLNMNLFSTLNYQHYQLQNWNYWFFWMAVQRLVHILSLKWSGTSQNSLESCDRFSRLYENETEHWNDRIHRSINQLLGGKKKEKLKQCKRVQVSTRDRSTPDPYAEMRRRPSLIAFSTARTKCAFLCSRWGRVDVLYSGGADGAMLRALTSEKRLLQSTYHCSRMASGARRGKTASSRSKRNEKIWWKW